MVFYLNRPVMEVVLPDHLRAVFYSSSDVYFVMPEAEYESVKDRLPVQTYVLARQPMFDLKPKNFLEGVGAAAVRAGLESCRDECPHDPLQSRAARRTWTSWRAAIATAARFARRFAGAAGWCGRIRVPAKRRCGATTPANTGSTTKDRRRRRCGTSRARDAAR